ETPTGHDSTETIFGIKPPREYHGAQATPARIESQALPASLNLQAARTLRLSINDGPPIEIDCAANAANIQAVAPDDIARNVNDALQAAGAAASVKLAGGRLALETTTNGATSRIDLLVFPGDDAREKLHGKQPKVTPGSDPAPATIKGE